MLEAMNRRHSRADYLRLVERLRRARPDIAFSSDFIVGFPGETEDDFRDTQRLMSEVGFASAYSFKYSPRPGTPAADLEQLPEAMKDERLQRLQDDIERHQAAFMARCVGMTFDVLFDKPGRHPGQIVGRSPYLQPVPVTGPTSLIGEIAPVTVTEVRTNSLFGMLANARKLDAPLAEAKLTEEMGA
jgi:tRNA-2-methylthio-N6-dimethylallyladenosine synthase